MKKCQPSPFLGSWQEKFLAVYLALVIVVVINFLVFSYLLTDREQARASLSIEFANIMTNLPSQNVMAGSTNVLVAEMITPDSYTNSVLGCNWYLGGSCSAMIDADGSGTTSPGIDDDGAVTVLDLIPRTAPITDAIFKASDHVCTNSLLPPVAEVYVDGGDGVGGFDCVPGNDPNPDIIILDDAIPGLGAGLYFDVSAPLPSTFWVHSELVNNNLVYDYCDPGLNPGCGTAETETIWIFAILPGDTVLRKGNLWDQPYLNQWQGDSFAAWIFGLQTFVDLNSNGVLDDKNTGETVIIDKDSDGMVTSEADLLIDADGIGSTAPGLDDDALATGATLGILTGIDNVCINNLGGTGNPTTGNPIIVYVDGSGDCIPGNGGTDQLVRDDTSTGLPGIIAGLGAYPYTFFNAANLLVYSDTLNPNGKWDFGAGSAATESLWLEHSGWNAWNTSAEGGGASSLSFVDADGIGTVSTGIDDDGLNNNDVLTYLKASDQVCFAISSLGGTIEDVYIDTSGDCIPQNDAACSGGMPCAHPNLIFDWGAGGVPDGLNIATTFDAAAGGQWVSGAGVFAYRNLFTPGDYSWSNNAGATESLWTEIINSTIYSPSADDYLWRKTICTIVPLACQQFDPAYNFALTDLSTATGSGGFSLQWVDSDSSGTLAENDSILEDDSNFAGSPANSKIDRIEDYVSRIMVKNSGTAQANSDYTLSVCESGAGNFWCDAPTNCNPMTWNGSGWEIGGMEISFLSSGLRACFLADINASAVGGRTIQLQIPKLIDTGATPGLYDAGEEGLFLYSQNDGPTDAAYTVPYVFTINAMPSYGSRPQDYTAPGIVINVSIKADSTGKVALTWTDPTDADLSKIIIDETLAGQTKTFQVDPGVQTLVLENRELNKVYTYKLRAQDVNGNLSAAVSYNLTILSTGESTASQPEFLPAPIIPGSALPMNVNVGDLVKSASSPSVFYIGQDNRKHNFPSELLYKTWYESFRTVKIISDTDLNMIETGKDVYYREGTYIMKKPSDPKCYAVEPGGVLRWIENETIAENLYGRRWIDRIIDLKDEMFNQYTLGSSISSNVHPTATLINYSGSSKIYFIENGKKREVSVAVFSQSRFQDRFVAKGIATSISYPDDLVLTAKEEVGYFQ